MARISDTSRIDFSHEIRGRFLSTGAESLGLGQFWKMGLSSPFHCLAVWLAFDLLKVCIKAINHGNYLAIFLFKYVPILLFGLLGQPTNLGFAAFGGGLCLAAARAKRLLDAKDSQGPSADKYRKDEQACFASANFFNEISTASFECNEIFPNQVAASHRLHPSKSGRPTPTSILFFS